MSPTQELRTRAEILHHKIQSGDQRSLDRLRALPGYRRATYETLEAAAPTIRRTDCLSVLAAELGFENWPEAKRALDGTGPVDNFGTLLCHPRSSAHLNLWFKTHSEATQARAERDGYLLAYRNHYFVADHYYIADSLQLDPADPDWAAIGYDWARPADPAARTRLYGKLVARLPR